MKNFTNLLKNKIVVLFFILLLILVFFIVKIVSDKKRNSEIDKILVAEAVSIKGKLKSFILDKETTGVNCPNGEENMISYVNGGETISVFCNDSNGQIEIKKESDTKNLLSNGVKVKNCQSFVKCSMTADGSFIKSFDFQLNFELKVNKIGHTASFQTVIAPGE